MSEYVNDTNRQYVETLTAYTINSGATESYSYAGNQRLSRNNIWDEAQGVRCNQTSYYLYDGRGSVTANTWYNGMVTDVYQYDPYGQVELGSTKHTDFYGYNAESYNPNSGLEFLRARYYNANQGRFFQEDTYLGNIIDPLTLNRYAYGKNSPMNYVDPSGHFVLTLSSIAIAGALGGVLSMGISIYHQTQTTGSVDIGDTVKATLIGATGAVIGTVTATLVATGLAAAGVTGAFTATQAFAIGATTSAVSGMAVRANSSILVEGLNPNPNPYHNSPLDSLNTAINHALDPRMVAIDTLMGGVSGVLWYKINEAINKKQTENCEPNNKGEAEANKTTSGKSRAPETGTPGSTYEQVDDKGNVMSRTKYGENGRPEYREDLTGRPHYDKNTGEYLEQHRHNFKYNDKGQPIGETVTPIPD